MGAREEGMHACLQGAHSPLGRATDAPGHLQLSGLGDAQVTLEHTGVLGVCFFLEWS